MDKEVLEKDFSIVCRNPLQEPGFSGTIFTKRNYPIQKSDRIDGEIFTEDVGYLTVAQQLQRFRDAGQVLFDYNRSLALEKFKDVYTPEGTEQENALGRAPLFLDELTAMDIYRRKEQLLKLYMHKDEPLPATSRQTVLASDVAEPSTGSAEASVISSQGPSAK